MRIRVVAIGLLAAGALLAGCGGGSGGSADTGNPDAGNGPTLSAKWRPQLDALSNGTGITDCQDPSTTACLTTMTADLKTFTAVLKDINSAGAVDQYPKAVAALQKYVAAAEDFSEAGCPGNASAGQILSQCYGDASTVTVGITNLESSLQADEMA